LESFCISVVVSIFLVMAEDLHKGAAPKLFHYSRENRQTSTEAEALIWKALRGKKLHGFKFRRQHPISDFVADFYCHECKLIIEPDGGYHNRAEQKQHDDGRTYELNELKIKVIRFTNEEVIKDRDFVLNEISSHLIKISKRTT
jgi:very-short-patch-repair endonuclease